MSLFDNIQYSEIDIIRLIDEKVEESINLEFKDADSLGRSDGKKKEISKDISSFANSGGGIIIYGLKEENHVVNSLSFIDGEEYTKEWLENIISTNIQERIQDIQIHPIRFENDLKQTVYLVKIPESSNAPHMAKDSRFYKRYNFQSIPMEQFEVRSVFNKTRKTCLEIIRLEYTCRPSGYLRKEIYEHVEFSIFPIIKNVGSLMEDNYKLEVILNKKIYSGKLEYLNREEGEQYFLSFPATTPIFQDEELSISPLSIILNPVNFDPKDDLILKIKLFYSYGTNEKNFILNDLLTVKNKKISEIKFEHRQGI